MMEKNEGHIVSVASLAGHVGVPKLTDYCASKSAVIAFDEALRMELAEDGYTNIHTTVICPYFIRSTGMFDAVESRFVSALNSNEVADRIIMAMRCNEQFVILPGYFQGLLAAKWIFPWACFEMFIRGLVQDAGPENERTEKSQNVNQQEYAASKDQNGAIHQQLTRRISSSERKP
ncbi:hypothetical protein PV325_003481 [Microctonus aethiopoides]|nr:hypothetical protein PV325_003481 [Microctonus aethiopoides]